MKQLVQFLLGGILLLTLFLWGTGQLNMVLANASTKFNSGQFSLTLNSPSALGQLGATRSLPSFLSGPFNATSDNSSSLSNSKAIVSSGSATVGKVTVRLNDDITNAFNLNLSEVARVLNDNGVTGSLKISISKSSGNGQKSGTMTDGSSIHVDCNVIRLFGRPRAVGNFFLNNPVKFCNGVALHEIGHAISISKTGFGGKEEDQDAFALRNIDKYELVVAER